MPLVALVFGPLADWVTGILLLGVGVLHKNSYLSFWLFVELAAEGKRP
ncbi:hypothetical protein IGI46_001841 [Enterococcus sp. AZ163]